MQFKAGYISDPIDKILKSHLDSLDNSELNDKTDHLRYKGLLQYVTSFDIEFPFKHNSFKREIHPILAVVNNIISRGLPTKAPLVIETVFNEIGLIEKNETTYEIGFRIRDKNFTSEEIFRLFHFIDPDLIISQASYGGNLGSQLEWQFISQYPILAQVLESQRDFSSISSNLRGGRSVDFSYVSPYLIWNEKGKEEKRKGIIIEVDGIHHSALDAIYYDKFRDENSAEADFETLRLNTLEVFDSKNSLENLLGRELIEIFEENYAIKPLEKAELYTLVLAPIGVARIQKALIEYLISDHDLFSKEIVKIAIIERDIPCAGLAIKSLNDLFSNLNQLVKEHCQLNLPQIELDIFENRKWVISDKLHCQGSVKEHKYFQENTYDIIIDNAILKRNKVYKESTLLSEKAILIRSSHYCDTSQNSARKFYCSKLLEFEELVYKKDDGTFLSKIQFEESIQFFLQNIFRKTEFREGQLPIISRALQNKPVIGLLPTGGGKSITYQLPILLQPGLSLIVDPIKSLMEDQVRVLRENLIDGCEFINSNLNRVDRDRILLNFRNGECLFLFISPERLVMSSFRSLIQNIDSNRYKLAFSYCVIDEVHCVSEWGHDFRSTYLMLGQNAQKYAKTKGKPITILGLTATASFDVLSDIERELKIEADDIADSIIMIENTIRPELFFRVLDVTEHNRIEILNEKFLQLPSTLNQFNQVDILEKSLTHHFSEFESDIKQNELPKLVQNGINQIKLDIDFEKISSDDLASIVFCLVKGDKKDEKGEFKNQSGVRYIHESLMSCSKGYFYGTENEDDKDDTIAFFNEFVNGNLQHIVCTKAFGMGIDKSDIRSTFHYNFPNSFESFVQEAGRAGRNKKVAIANILFSKDKVFKYDYCSLQEFEKNGIKFEKINDTNQRRDIRRMIISKEFSSIQSAHTAIEDSLNNIQKYEDFKRVNLNKEDKLKIMNRIQHFQIESYSDRGTLDYFFHNNFKGKDVEYSQIFSLFHDREFEISERLAELTKQFNSLNSLEYSFKYWSTPKFKRIYISDITEKQLGFIDLNQMGVSASDNDTAAILENILTFLKSSVGVDTNLIQEIRSSVITELNDDILSNIFKSNIDGEFDFIITSEKIFPDNYVLMYFQLLKNPGQFKAKVQFEKAIRDFKNRNSSFDQLFIEKGSYLKFRISGFDGFSFNKNNQHYTKLEELYQSSDASEFVKEVFAFQIELAKNRSQDFSDFLLLLEEHFNKLEFEIERDFEIIHELKRYYYRSRYFKPTNDTGRLIYRMHSMGLLKDYTIDYNKNNLYHCRLVKYSDVNVYVSIIQEYLKRYLSENSASRKVKILIAKLKYNDLVEDVITCLNFLADFSFEEIASKRKRATDEIENALVSAIEFTDDFTQNIYLKEQIFFYFNAKYARIGFKIEGEQYSLTDDFKAEVLDKRDLLFKYLNVYQKDKGSEQNNYKHMIGSCKKILRSLVKSEFEKDWILRLIKAFAMYAVNNPSYISEANEDLEKGFENLYLDTSIHQDDFAIIYEIFKGYKEILEKNINQQNRSFFDIQLILMNILIKLQSRGIDKLISTNTQLVNNHA